MKTIAYVGMSDSQEFTKSDFAKAGVDEDNLPKSKITFAQGEPVEVNDQLAELLLDDAEDNVLGYAKFKDVTPPPEGEENSNDGEGEKKAPKIPKTKSAKTSGKEATTEGTANSDSGTSSSGPTSTGAGSSTGGSPT